ncbi:MAG TPA: hypothetical protein PKA27_06970 [Fimbriimonadaceae bacterium]|nr:hypothetical protein [Fimbriimonadaceae bacterium]
MTNQEIFKLLSSPWPLSEVRIRPCTLTKDKTRAVPALYVNAAAMRARLDEVLGFSSWSAELREVKGGMLCRLTVVLPCGRVVVREDVCGPSDVDPLKGSASGAFKRAAVALGLPDLSQVALGWFAVEPAGSSFRFTKSSEEAIRSVYARSELKVAA